MQTTTREVAKALLAGMRAYYVNGESAKIRMLDDLQGMVMCLENDREAGQLDKQQERLVGVLANFYSELEDVS